MARICLTVHFLVVASFIPEMFLLHVWQNLGLPRTRIPTVKQQKQQQRFLLLLSSLLYYYQYYFLLLRDYGPAAATATGGRIGKERRGKSMMIQREGGMADKGTGAFGKEKGGESE